MHNFSFQGAGGGQLILRDADRERQLRNILAQQLSSLPEPVLQFCPKILLLSPYQYIHTYSVSKYISRSSTERLFFDICRSTPMKCLCQPVQTIC